MATFIIELDDLTVARLMALADCCKKPAEAIISSIVSDVLEDDAKAHYNEHTMTMVH